MELNTWAIGILLAIVVGLLYFVVDILGEISKFLMPPNEFPKTSIWQKKRRVDKYPKEFCEKVRTMWKNGSNAPAIAKIMRLPVSTVYYIIHIKDKTK